MSVSPALLENSKFDILKNEMFFNILVFDPDSSVIDFVRKYFPIYCSMPKPGKWTIYPAEPTKFMKTAHSLFFIQHPHFHAKFREGKLDFISLETNDTGRSIQFLQLWFMFDSKNDAMIAFKELSAMFNKVSKEKKITEEKDKIIASYTDQDHLSRSNSVQFVLTNDELYENKYKMLLRMESNIDPGKSNDRAQL